MLNDSERRYFDCFKSMDKFGTDHNADMNPIAKTTFEELHDILAGVDDSGADVAEARGDLSQLITVKGLKREAAREWASEVAETARGMIYVYPGIDDIFRMPRNRNDADLLAAIRGMVQAGDDYNTAFQDFGLPSTWIADGAARADEFETAIADADGAQATSSGKTAALADWIVQGSRKRRVLIPVVKNIYRDNPEMLAAWATASHLERPTTGGGGTPPTP